MPSANTTAAIDNLTLAIQGLDESMASISTTLAAAAALLFELALLVSLLIVSLRSQEFGDRLVLSLVSGVVTLIIGLLWVDDYPGVSIVLWFLAAYQVAWRGMIPALASGGPARGLSQFKGLINRVRGR